MQQIEQKLGLQFFVCLLSVYEQVKWHVMLLVHWIIRKMLCSIAENMAESIAFTYIDETSSLIRTQNVRIGSGNIGPKPQTILRQCRRDPGIGILPIPNPGIEKSTPGLQSIHGIYGVRIWLRREIYHTVSQKSEPLNHGYNFVNSRSICKFFRCCKQR